MCTLVYMHRIAEDAAYLQENYFHFITSGGKARGYEKKYFLNLGLGVRSWPGICENVPFWPNEATYCINRENGKEEKCESGIFYVFCLLGYKICFSFSPFTFFLPPYTYFIRVSSTLRIEIVIKASVFSSPI
jgi:hypothetical protein